MEIFDVRLLGVSVESGQKLLLTIALIVIVYLLRRILRGLAWLFVYNRSGDQTRFWLRQGINAVTTVILVLGSMSIWFEQADRFATALGLITVAIGFALQRVILSMAAYLAILQGKIYRAGDRVQIADVRGDVIAIGFVHTTLMEMGEPANNDVPGGWVQSRQYTGRVVTISNARIFDDSVHNFSRDFPYVWEEISIPISYEADRGRAERILLDAATAETAPITQPGKAALESMQRQYFVRAVDPNPRVYWRITDNWLELTVRFLAPDRGIRELKDGVSRAILAGLDEAGIQIASATYEIVGMPPVRITGNGQH